MHQYHSDKIVKEVANYEVIIAIKSVKILLQLLTDGTAKGSIKLCVCIVSFQ